MQLSSVRFAGLVTADQEGSLWLNGLVFGGVLGGPQQALMRGIFAEMQTLQEHVYYQAVQDDTPDILAELLRLEGALQRYNPRILEKPSSPDRYHHCTLAQPCPFDVSAVLVCWSFGQHRVLQWHIESALLTKTMPDIVYYRTRLLFLLYECKR